MEKIPPSIPSWVPNSAVHLFTHLAAFHPQAFALSHQQLSQIICWCSLCFITASDSSEQFGP